LVELSHDLRHAADGVVDDPLTRGGAASASLLKQIRRKYGETLVEVIAHCDECGRLAQLGSPRRARRAG
jgi:hypothetical protein